MVVAAVHCALRTVVTVVAAVHCALGTVVMVVAAVHCALRTVVMVVHLSYRFSSNSVVSGATGGHSTLFQHSVTCFVPLYLNKASSVLQFWLSDVTNCQSSRESPDYGFQLEHLLTCLITPWSRILLEKLTGSQLVKKLLAFYGTRMFITAFTRSRHVCLS